MAIRPIRDVGHEIVKVRPGTGLGPDFGEALAEGHGLGTRGDAVIDPPGGEARESQSAGRHARHDDDEPGVALGVDERAVVARLAAMPAEARAAYADRLAEGGRRR